MKLVVITTPQLVPGEEKIWTALFQEGLERLHLRKPESSAAEVAALLRGIPAAYHGRIVLHEHFELTESFALHGIHLNRRHPQAPQGYTGSISCSCHSIAEAAEKKASHAYVFLSPIYDSISKEGYGSHYTAEQLQQARDEGIIDAKVIALGGISLPHLSEVKAFGFGGAAVLGELWNRFPAYLHNEQEQQQLLQHFLRLKAAADTPVASPSRPSAWLKGWIWWGAALPLTGLQAGEAVHRAPATADDHRPNLLFIMADQWRGDALGCLGKEPVQTPHLDRLAQQGVHFTQAVSSYPVSSPARAMLMTGMYPHRNKVVGNCNSANAPYGVELPQEARCWSDVLKENGYRTGYIGKWHLDAPQRPYVDTYNNRGKIAWNEWCPKERRHGFDYWTAYGTYDRHLHPMYWDTEAPRDSFYYVHEWGPVFEADRAIEFLNQRPDRQQPFALVVSMNPPHTGYDLVPDRYKAVYQDLDVEALVAGRPDIPAKGTEMGDYYRKHTRNYYACMTGVDEQIGRILDELKRLGLAENTIVVFSSDHGICMGAHHEKGKNVFYEESMRIPMIVSWPRQLRPRVDAVTPMAFADLCPTLLSLMGLKKQIPETVQSFDLAPLLLKEKENARLVQPYYCIQPSQPATGHRGLRSQRYTFVVHATQGKVDEVWLFDRQTDPYQLHNLASEQPRRVKQWMRKLKAWLKQTGDPFHAYLSIPVESVSVGKR